MQSATLLTSMDAHFLYACTFLGTRAKADRTLMPLLRAMEAGRRAAEAAVNVTERFLGSSYGSRDSSPALVNEGIRDAISLAIRDRSVQSLNKAVHSTPLDISLPLRGLSGNAFLLMILPALAATLSLAASNSTVTIRGEHFGRLDTVFKDAQLRSHFWLNRRNALTSHPAWLIVISSTSPALGRTQAEQWLKGEFPALATITPRGLIEGIQKCHGVLGFSVSPQSQNFRICLALPT